MVRSKVKLMRYATFFLLAGTLMAADPAYRAEIEKFRKDRAERLTADDGYLTITGLLWLKPGVNRVGSAASADVKLPQGAPADAGVLTLNGESSTFEPAAGVTATLNGKSISGKVAIKSDASGSPDTIGIGRFKLLFIFRDPRYAIRLKDNESDIRRNFAGCSWFPIKEEWRLTGKFMPQPGASKIRFETVAGTHDTVESAGFVTFKKDGQEYKLEAAKSGNRLWFVFRDGTSGKTTYGGARQLYADAPRDGVVVLDFNKAINLPCAFSPYTTCPIPPPQNRLKVAIEAGELDYNPKAGAKKTD